MTEHSRIDEHGLLGGYVTDALDEREREEFEDHMAGCEVCTRDSREFAETFAELTFATQLTPPRELRDAVLGAVARVRPLPAADHPRHARGPVPVSPVSPVPAEELAPVATVSSLELIRARRTRRVLALAVAAVAVVALALGGWAVNVRQQAQQQQVVADQQAQLTRTINDLLAAPDAEVVRGNALQNGGRASYVVSKSRDQAALIATDVQALPADRVYQVWTTANAAQFRSAGTFSGSGTVQVLINGNVDDTKLLAITVEPSNGGAGSTAPTIIEGVQPFGVADVPA